MIVNVERYVIDLWSNFLGIDKIDPSTSFFDEKGDSMLMVQMLVKALHDLQVEIDVEAFLEEPTAANFIRTVNEARLSAS